MNACAVLHSPSGGKGIVELIHGEILEARRVDDVLEGITVSEAMRRREDTKSESLFATVVEEVLTSEANSEGELVKNWLVY